MEATTLTDVQGDYVAGIMRASNVLLTIVNVILDVTKIESGAIALESIPMSLRDVVEFTLHTNAPAAAKQGVELICNIDPTLNTSVLGDPTRIRQILHNLVSNALKFTPTGEVEVTLTLEDGRVEYGERHVEDGEESETTVKVAPRARSRWRLSVRDTGIGIDEEGKQKLFREFSQVDETTTRMYGGTGLGLFICKELSEIMGGNVSVESEVGVGSTFTATFLTDHADEKDEAPVHIVSSDIRWTAVLYTTNSALTRVLQTYLRYFFSGVREVTFVALDRPKVAEQRIRTLLASSSPTDRLVVLANHSDCTNSLTRSRRRGRWGVRVCRSSCRTIPSRPSGRSWREKGGDMSFISQSPFASSVLPSTGASVRNSQEEETSVPQQVRWPAPASARRHEH